MLHVLPFCQQIGPVEHVYPRGTATTYYQDKPFVFQALTWNLVTTGSLTDQNDEKETASENRESYVFVTGTTETELSCSLRVPVEPWFMMKLGRVDDDDETPWSQQELDTFLQDYYLTRRTYDEEEHKTVTKEHHRTYSVKENNKKYRVTYKSALERTEVVYQYDYDAGFTGPQPKKFQFLKLYWKTDRAKKSAAYLCTNEKLVEDLKKEQGLTIKPYEGALETTIRLMHDTNCTSTGWMQVNPGYYVFDRRRQPVLKTAVRLKLKKTHDFASAMEPYLPYQDKKEVGIRMCSFDLETYSSTGKFPNPKVDGDTIFQISCYFKDFGKSETWTVLLHLKHMDPLNLDPSQKVFTIYCRDEHELLIRFAQLIRACETDILHAWNGFGFDFPYIIERAKKRQETWTQVKDLMSRIEEQPAYSFQKELKSSAYGANVFEILQCSGRVSFDPMVHIKKEQRRENNSLNAVSEDYLSYSLANKKKVGPICCTEGKSIVTIYHPNHPFKEKDVIHIYNLYRPDLTPTADGKGSEYTLGGYNFDDWHEQLHDIVEIKDKDHYCIDMHKPATKTVLNGGGLGIKVFESKHDVTAHQMFEAFKQSDKAMLRLVALYCIQDTRLPQRIIDKLAILPFLLALSRVCWVPISYLITHGQQVKYHSQITKAANEDGYAVHMVIHPREQEKDALTQMLQELEDNEKQLTESFIGGMVFPAKDTKGFYVDPVAVPDYCSLYPSRIWDGNYSHDTLVKNSKYDNMAGVQYQRVFIQDGPNGEFDRTHVWAQSFRGVLCKAVGKLLDERKIAKKQLSKATDPMEKLNLDAKQLALKISANSIYGATGDVHTGKLPCKAIAESTTQTGREATQFAADYTCDRNNFADVMQCTTHFPLNYYYWVCIPKRSKKTGEIKKLKSAYFGQTIKQLQEKGVDGLADWLVWGDQGWTKVVGFDADERGYVRVQMERGKTVTMEKYRCCRINVNTHEMEDKVVYGDSVTGETPIMLRNTETQRIHITTIDLFDQLLSNDWQAYDAFKPNDGSVRTEKQCILGNNEWEIWTDSGWQTIRRLIRHKVNKKLFGVSTRNGYVQVTEDHSLLDENGNILTAKGLVCEQTKLLTKFPSVFDPKEALVFDDRQVSKETHFCTHCKNHLPKTDFYTGNGKLRNCCKTCDHLKRQKKRKTSTQYVTEASYFKPYTLTEDEAWVWGLFMADGSCGRYDTKYGPKNSWAINKKDRALLEKAKAILEKCEPYFKFKILDTVKSSHVYKLVPNKGRMKFIVEKYAQYMYDSNRRKIVPEIILNAPIEIRKAFFSGYYTGDGWKQYTEKSWGSIHQVTSQTLYYLAKSIGKQDLYIHYCLEKNFFQVSHTKPHIDRSLVFRVEELPKSSDGVYVYDLETASGHFAAGVGEIVVKNTDSVFTRFETSHLATIEEKTIYSMFVAAYVSDEITQRLREMNPYWPKEEQRMELGKFKSLTRVILDRGAAYTSFPLWVFGWSRVTVELARV